MADSRDDALATCRAELAREQAAHARTKKRLAQAERRAAAWERVARMVHAAAHPQPHPNPEETP